MKRITLLALAAATTFAAQAQQAGFTDRARVTNVEPQYETVQLPREECRTDWVTETRPTGVSANVGGAILGGVAGGLLGHQVGKGSGKDVATAAGVVVGAAVGNQIANQGRAPVQADQREVRSCRTVFDAQSRINGYRVTYEYQGHAYTTVMPGDPGRSIPVRVSITPMEPEYHRR